MQQGAVGLTVVCQDALRSNHLIADVADDKTEILQCGEVAAVEHVWKKSTSRLESAQLSEAASGGRNAFMHRWPSHPTCEVGPAINQQSTL